MSADGRIRLEIAFEGGQTLLAAVTADVADGLQRALAGGDDTVFELDSDDVHYVIALRRVVYVKRFARETRIGFGGAG
jgi:hypothetical protein